MGKDLILKQASQLPATIEELQEFILVGKAKLKTYHIKVKLIKDLNLAKKVKEQALEDGQNVGEAILWAEARLGELIDKCSGPPQHFGPKHLPIGGRQKKFEELGFKQRTAFKSVQISKHPELIEEVIKEARENEDLPTKTAVLSKIREKQEKERVEKAPPKSKTELIGEEFNYQQILLEIISILPLEPPKQLTEQGFRVLNALAKTITKRLRRFEDGT